MTRLILVVWAALTAAAFTAVVRTFPHLDFNRGSIAYLQEPDTLERAACLRGVAIGKQFEVVRSVPAMSVPELTTATRIVAWCDTASKPLGMMHTHPKGQNCYYYFPTTHVLSSDGMSANMQPFVIDAILCGDTVVWYDIGTQEEHKQPAPERVRVP